MSDASAESSEDSGTVKILQESSRSRLKAGEHYWSIHFSGCGFMLPYHFGAAACLLDHGITFEKVTASSGGVMAALALLRGADLHLGIRQCFDLRNEKATTPSSIRSFFAVYREYFRCFRNAHYRKNHGLQKLNGRLYVRLGRWTTKGGWEIYQVTNFASEQELEDAFMSAAYVPFGTSVLPPYFRGTVAYDAALVDALSGSIGFHAQKSSLWPPEDEEVPLKKSSSSPPPSPSRGKRAATVDRTKVLVVPTRGIGHYIDPSDLVVVNGRFRSLIDFWAHPSVMKRGFLEGYQMMAALIDGPPPRSMLTSFFGKRQPVRRSARRRKIAAKAAEGDASGPQDISESSAASDSVEQEEKAIAAHAEALFESVMEEQSTWKKVTGFVKPLLWFEQDPLFALFILVGLLIYAIAYAYASPRRIS